MKFKREFLEKIEKMDPVDRPMVYKDHKLKTRRDFLAQGFMGSFGFTLAPSILSLMRTDIAMAAEGCNQAAPAATKTPLLIIDLAGGNMMAGNHMIVGANSQDSLDGINYSGFGYPDAISPSMNQSLINTDFNVAMNANSTLLQGMQEATATIRQNDANFLTKVDGGFFAAQSENDRSTNPLNPVYWIAKAGATGTLTTTCGTDGGDSGGRSVPPGASIDPLFAPVRINRTNDLTNLINLGVVQDQFGNNGIAKVQRTLAAVEKMSESKINKFSNQTLSEQLQQMAECGYDTSRYTSQTASTGAIDPQQDPVITRNYTGNENNRGRTNYSPDSSSAEACVVKALVDGMVGVGTIVLGGYDYHGNDRATQDAKDLKVGQTIGRALSVAAEKNKPLMILVITDGGVSTSTELQAGGNGVNKFRYRGDNSSRGGAMTFLFNPLIANPGDSIRANSGRQIGEFTVAGQVDRTTGSLIQATGQNINGNFAAVVAANYLALHGEEASFLNIVGDTYQSIQNDLDRYLLYKPAA